MGNSKLLDQPDRFTLQWTYLASNPGGAAILRSSCFMLQNLEFNSKSYVPAGLKKQNEAQV